MITCLGICIGTLLIGFNKTFYWCTFGESLENIKLYIKKGHLGGKESSNYTFISQAEEIGTIHSNLVSPSINILIKSITIISILIILFLNQ